MDLLNSLLPTIEHFYIFGYWLAFFAALLETMIGVGLVFPGSTIVLIMGTLAAKGYLDVGDLIWFAVIGAIIGDNFNYYLGRKYGAKWLGQGVWFFKPAYFEKSKDFFNKHGARSIFLGRFVAGIKEIVPFAAGLAKMKRRLFIVWNILGAIGWGLAWILAGYFFGQFWQLLAAWLSRLEITIAVIVIFILLFYLLERLIVKRGWQFFALLKSIWLSVKEAFIANKDVIKFITKHERSIGFLKARLDRHKFSGLPLTVLAIAFLYVLSLLLGVIEDAAALDPITRFDIRLADLFYVFRDDKLVDIFLWITALGKWQVIFIKALLVLSLLRLWHKRVFILPFCLALLSTEIFVWFGKIIFHRARPAMGVYVESSFSFPSGHAAIAAVFYGLIIYILWRSVKSRKNKINILFTGLFVILGIGFSRIYLGVHYLSDVWAGYLVGALWVIIAISISERRIKIKKDEQAAAPLPAKSLKIVSAVLICVTIVLYIGLAVKYHPSRQAMAKVQETAAVGSALDIFSVEAMPKYTETLVGRKQEPLNFIIIVKGDLELIKAFKMIGWQLADQASFSSIAKLAQAAVLKKSYLAAPITPSFWHARAHDFGFEKETESNTVRERHHARFWRTNYVIDNGKRIYAGAASFGKGIKRGIAHKIMPDIDTEREFLFNSLEKAGIAANFQKRQLVEPALGENFSGDLFFTDGNAYIIEF